MGGSSLSPRPSSLTQQDSVLPSARSPLPGPNRINSEHLLVLGARDEAP